MRIYHLARLGSVALLVPAVFALSLGLPDTALPTGVKEALGCSGAGNVPRPSGFTWLKPTQIAISDRTSISIATDGFFMIDAEANDLTAEQVEAALSVEVTDQAGLEVVGTLELFKEHRPGWYVFAWTSAEPLGVGAKLTASLHAEPAAMVAVGGDFELVVTGPPTPLSAGALSFAGWMDFYRGVGEPITCEAAYVSVCGGSQTVIKSVPQGLIKQLATNAKWSLPPIVGDVAWEARLAVSSAQADATLPPDKITYLTDPDTTELGFGSLLVFPTKADSYCVKIVVKDLRTQAEVQTEACEAPQPSIGAASDSEVLLCLTPPNQAVTEGWCAAHAHSMLPECVAIRSAAPLTDVDAGATHADDSTPPVTDAPGDGASNQGDGSTRISGGCQLGSSPALSGGALPLLALLMLGRRRRR